MTKANIIERAEVSGMKVVFGSGVNPVNSPAQFFVAWGKEILANGLIHTFNCETPEAGFIWFIDEELAEAKYEALKKSFSED
jgi:hypothetical protein